MRTLRAFAIRLQGFLRRADDERDFAEQIEADLELHIDDAMRGGMNREEARRAALLKLGGVGAAKEAWRDRHGVPVLDSVVRDITYAFRVLGRNKGWTAVAIVSLALGIGANTAVFSAASSVLLRRLPVPAAAELVTLQWRGESRAFTDFSDYGFVTDGMAGGFLGPDGGAGFSLDNIRAGVTGAYETFQRLKASNTTLQSFFAVGSGPTVNLIADGHGETASSLFVSGDFFTTLRVPPAAGRWLVASDDRRDAAPVAVISYGYWDRRFARNPAIVGKAVRLNAVAFTIVGVAGRSTPNVFGFGESIADVVIPLVTEPAFRAGSSKLTEPTSWWLVMMGRRKPGVSNAQIEANLRPVYEQAGRDGAATFLAKLPPEDLKEAAEYGLGSRIPRLHAVSGARGAYDTLAIMFRSQLLVLCVLVGIVLLVVAANLTNLSLALTTTREREIAMRRALGATRGRVIRQILTEHLVLALLGGAASLLAAFLFQEVIRLLFPSRFDWTVVAFAFTAAAITGVAIGILPALRASRAPVRVSADGGSSSRRSRLTGPLLAAQVAMSLALVVGAGLFVRTLINLQRVDPGFDSRNLVIFSLDPRFNQYDDARAETLYHDLVARLRTIPGVGSAAFSSHSILDGNRNTNFVYAEGAKAEIPAQNAFSMVVQENFFDTMGLPVHIGRSFTDRDSKNAPGVAIINAALARALFGDENPVGRRFFTTFQADRSKAGPETGKGIEVVGVVADTHHASLRAAPPRIYYRPHLQSDFGPRTFEVRTVLPPEDLMPAIRKVVQELDPALPILSLGTLRSVIANQWAQERLVAIASGTLGGLALTISVIGLFGVMSYAVTRRTKDIGIRMALGAERGNVLRSVMREAMILVAVGIAIGLAVTLFTTRLLEAQLFGLSPNDPGVIVLAIGVMLVVAAAAGYLPARRASRVDPMVALRHE